jgi:hypothetical protein
VRTSVGSLRVLAMLVGEQLPRICRPPVAAPAAKARPAEHSGNAAAAPPRLSAGTPAPREVRRRADRLDEDAHPPQRLGAADPDLITGLHEVVDYASAGKVFGPPITQEGTIVLPVAKIGGVPSSCSSSSAS